MLLFQKNLATKKDLCSDLLAKLKEMNKNKKDNNKNIDRKLYLNEYESEFNEIKFEAAKLITNNNYAQILFNVILFCYLNFYDYISLSSIIGDLFIKKPNDLYELLLIYNSH